MSDILQRLYDSEINAGIMTFWDCGFVAGLGDILNGFKEHRNCATLAEAEAFLDEAARRHYPDSKYARGAQAFNPGRSANQQAREELKLLWEVVEERRTAPTQDAALSDTPAPAGREG